MENANLRNIKYPASYDPMFDKIALKLGRSKRQILCQMIDYFFRSKKDPTDLNDELLKTTLLKSHKDYVGFIKVQEMELLVPIKIGTDRMIRNQEQIVKFFNEQVLKSNKDMSDKFNRQMNTLSAAYSILKIMNDNLETKEELKIKLLDIFDEFVRKREALGAFKTKEKEELLRQTLKRVDEL